MRITFGLITLNAGFFLRQVLESIYPVAYKIIIADGATKWWGEHGFSGSADDTIDIIRNFPDPEGKITLVRCGVVEEKDEQCRYWFAKVPSDTDYVFCVDGDEVHDTENFEKLIPFLEKEKPVSVGFKSDSFFGGFDRIMGGFEREHSFKRLLRYHAGCFYKTHRQPTLAMPAMRVAGLDYQERLIVEGIGMPGRDITGNQLYEVTGLTMWHGSYVSPKGVYNKIRYYEGAVIAQGQCIPNYFRELWLPWVQGTDEMKAAIENKFKGVHEFVPEARGECYTLPFTGRHPVAIEKSMPELLARFDNELNGFL